MTKSKAPRNIMHQEYSKLDWNGNNRKTLPRSLRSKSTVHIDSPRPGDWAWHVEEEEEEEEDDEAWNRSFMIDWHVLWAEGIELIALLKNQFYFCNKRKYRIQ